MKYRKISPCIWNDRKFMSLSTHGKLAMLFLLTHPNMTSLGAMRGTAKGFAEELPEVLPEAFAEAFFLGIAKADKKAPLIWFPKFMKYNPPESANVVKAWSKAWGLLPECDMKDEIFQCIKDLIEGYGEGYQKAFAEGFA